MTTLRVGTRGSDLALWQTRWVIDALRKVHPDLEFEETVIKTHGDVARDQPFDAATWPAGWFVGALEQALVASQIDFAVHSYKDLPSLGPDDLVIAAVPKRAAVHDALLTQQPVDLERIPAGFRIGTCSPRRRAQWRRHANVEIVPIRGNVPTRVAKLESGEVDGVVLAAAGVLRLGITAPHMTDLPTDRFIPAPAQGALAVKTRRDSAARELLAAIDHDQSRRAVTAERAFLAAVSAGCQTPLGALAIVTGDQIELHAQLFSDDDRYVAEGTEVGTDPARLGAVLAQRLRRQLQVMV